MRFENLVFHATHVGGIQCMVDFGEYKLSIIRSEFSYGGSKGLYEIGVFNDVGMTELKGVTNEDDTVKGFLTANEVSGILVKMVSLTGNAGALI